MTQIMHDANCGSFRTAYPGPCDCSATLPPLEMPRLTAPQRRLLAALQPIRQSAGGYRYTTAGRQRGSGLTSINALWRRGYVATNGDDRPDAYERRDHGVVHLTPAGEQLLAAIRKAG